MQTKLMTSKWIRISLIIYVWLFVLLLGAFGHIWFDLESWMFTGLFTILIPTTSALAGLIAIFFGRHYQPSQKINPDEGNKKFSELRSGFGNLIRNFFIIATICIILFPFSKVLGKYEGFPLLILIAIVVFTLYTFYDAFEFIKKSTTVRWQLELNETINIKDDEAKNEKRL